MERVKVGVIGVGVLGRHHARLYRECTDVELIGVFDVDTATASRVAQELGIQAFDSVNDLVNVARSLSVAVPTNLHFEVVEHLLEQGKHVLVEKPLAATMSEGRRLVELAARQNLILQVGHVERYNPVIHYLETWVDNPRFIEAHRLAPYPPLRPGLPPRGTEVGVVLDLMIHDIDVILHLVPSHVTAVQGVGIPVLSATEDIANARLTFADGCVANVTASRVSIEQMRKIRVFQSDAYLSLDYQERKGEIVRIRSDGIQREPVPIEDHNALQKQLEEFIRCSGQALASGHVPEPPTSGKKAQQALEIADEISKQIRSA
jgi:predicted dehydrogenase